MKISDTIRRTTPWDCIVKTIHDLDDLKAQEKMLREGTADFEVLTGGGWVGVPRLVVHQRAIPEACESCSS